MGPAHVGTPGAYRAKRSGPSPSQCRTPRPESLSWGSELSLLWGNLSLGSVTQPCPTLVAIDCSLLGSSVRGILQGRILELVAISYSGDLPNPGTEPVPLESPDLAGGFFTTLRHLGKPLCIIIILQFVGHSTRGLWGLIIS